MGLSAALKHHCDRCRRRRLQVPAFMVSNDDRQQQQTGMQQHGQRDEPATAGPPRGIGQPHARRGSQQGGHGFRLIRGNRSCGDTRPTKSREKGR
jgi:hypothetical protein